MKHLPKLVFLLLLLAAVIQAAHYYPLLPESTPAHFNAAGKVNGWSRKSAVVSLNLGLCAALTVLFFWIESSLRRAPDGLLNLPHKDYWLAPARREASVRALGGILMAVGAGALGFFLWLFQLTYEAGLTASPRLPSIGVLLIWPLALAGLAALWIVRRFPKPPR
jgi:uncharacterized membrane protein